MNGKAARKAKSGLATESARKTIKVLRILRKPLTVKQVQRLAKDNILTVVVPLFLDEVHVSVDCLNDAVSTMITGDESALEDISYRPVGVKGEDVLVEVTANVKDWLNRETSDGTVVRGRGCEG